jgi:spore coat protein U-like protein
MVIEREKQDGGGISVASRCKGRLNLSTGLQKRPVNRAGNERIRMMRPGTRILKTAVAAISLAGVGALLTSTRVSAGTATTNLSVTATVSNNCTISTTTVAFGAYDPVVTNASTALDGAGGVTIACTKGASSTIGLGLGSNASGATRRMANGSNYLTYELYKETGRTNVWGNSGVDLYTPAAAPSFAPRTFSVYGRVTAGQDVPAGSYSDTVVATVNF